MINTSPIDPLAFSAFSLLPIFFLLIWIAVSLGLLVFAILMVLRFVRAHEQIARQLEAIAQRLSNESKDKP
ncbi:MAG: hypothetical protein PHC88_12240 [Terrimicrobiaceae bacterium]|nr:hypothetical protein [Terrimicrobiaceae bacterium]